MATTSLTYASVLTSVSAAAYEAVINLRNGSHFKTESGDTSIEGGDSKNVGWMRKAGAEVGLLVTVLIGAVEWKFRGLLHIIAKIASYILPKKWDCSERTGRALSATTSATVCAFVGLYKNVFGDIEDPNHYDRYPKIWKSASKHLSCLPCCRKETTIV
jgi:hypothetical protein